jgi:hypothetical protein
MVCSFVLERKVLDTRDPDSTASFQDSCVKGETLPMAMVLEASLFTDEPLPMKTLTLRTVEQVCVREGRVHPMFDDSKSPSVTIS